MKKIIALIVVCFTFLVTFKYYTGAYLTPNDNKNVRSNLQVTEFKEEKFYEELSKKKNVGLDHLKNSISKLKIKYENNLIKDKDISIKNSSYEYKKVKFIDTLVSNSKSSCKIISECFVIILRNEGYKEVMFIDGESLSTCGSGKLELEDESINCRSINGNSIYIYGTSYIKGDIKSEYCKEYKKASFSIKDSKWEKCKVSKFQIVQHTYEF